MICRKISHVLVHLLIPILVQFICIVVSGRKNSIVLGSRKRSHRNYTAVVG